MLLGRIFHVLDFQMKIIFSLVQTGFFLHKKIHFCFISDNISSYGPDLLAFYFFLVIKLN